MGWEKTAHYARLNHCSSCAFLCTLDIPAVSTWGKKKIGVNFTEKATWASTAACLHSKRLVVTQRSKTKLIQLFHILDGRHTSPIACCIHALQSGRDIVFPPWAPRPSSGSQQRTGWWWWSWTQHTPSTGSLCPTGRWGCALLYRLPQLPDPRSVP